MKFSFCAIRNRLFKPTIEDKIVETIVLKQGNFNHRHPSPSPPFKVGVIRCLLHVARTVAQHCMEGMGE